MGLEIWLRQAEDRFRFPVLPAEIGLKSSISTATSKLIKLGELSAFAGKDLDSVDIDCFFPAQDYNFCEYYGFPKPYECIDKLKRWMKEGWILRLTITDTNINMECRIKSLDYKEKDATGDIYYSLEIEEVERFKIPLADIPGNGESNATQNTNKEQQSNSSAQAQQQRTHVVTSKDSLWSLAKKYYGDGSKYPVIFNANKDLIKNPDYIKDGWKLVIPWL